MSKDFMMNCPLACRSMQRQFPDWDDGLRDVQSTNGIGKNCMRDR